MTEVTPTHDDLAARISKALGIAPGGMYDGAHHKNWFIDQMVRALTGCPMVVRFATDAYGTPYTYEAQGESAEYREFVSAAGEWDEGIAP